MLAPSIWVLVLGVPQGLVNLANQNALYFQAQPERMGANIPGTGTRGRSVQGVTFPSTRTVGR